MEWWRRLKGFAWVAVGLVLFAGTLLDLVFDGPLRSWDHHLIASTRPAGTSPPIGWQAVADIGGVGVLSVILVIAALIHLYARRPVTQLVRAAAWILAIEAATWLAKVSVGRTAPGTKLDLLGAGGRSWPSGHSAASLALLLIAAALLFPPDSRADRIARWVVPVIAAAVAVATVHLQYHWPTDTIGGWALGLVFGTLAARSLRNAAPRI